MTAELPLNMKKADRLFMAEYLLYRYVVMIISSFALNRQYELELFSDENKSLFLEKKNIT